MNCNNYFDMTDQGDSFESWQGLRGPYYTPHLADDGTLTWTNNGGLPNPAPVDISGSPGRDVQLRGPVATVYDLPVTAPASELWQVGTQAPYNGYFFNGTSWVNLGPVAAGATFTPTVSSDGVISWTNDGGLPNPESVNIKGPQGTTGPDGVSPEVTIAQISGGHSVTITDADHPQGQQFDVMDGQTGATGPAGPGVPAGGSAGRVLRKQSATDYDTAWEKEDLGIIGASVYDFVRIHGVSNGKPTAFGRISDPNTNVGIVQNFFTATQNISKGQYVIWQGALYTASSAIASGATLSSSNLTAVSDGGLNQFLARSKQGRIAASGSATIQLESDSNGIVVFTGAGDAQKDIAIFRCTDQGNVSIKSMLNSSVGFSTSTNELTITNTATAAVLPYFIMYW